jgi:hypothetical protein
MRQWMNLFETVIDDQAILTEVYMFVSQYVTHGEWRTPTQFDADLTKLMTLIPRPEHPEHLYRALRLSDQQLRDYKAGTLVLHDRKFSSWTKSLDSAHRVAQVKGTNVIIVEQAFAPEHIVIDIPEFYEEHEYTRFGEFPEYHNYVKIEQEVIVYHSGEITVTAENSKVWSPPAITPPMIGDKVFYHDDDHEGLDIDAVAQEQPFAQRGLFDVELSDGDQATVCNTGPGEWEIVNLDIQESLAEGYRDDEGEPRDFGEGCWILPDGEVIDTDYANDYHHADIAISHFNVEAMKNITSSQSPTAGRASAGNMVSLSLSLIP